MYMQILIIIIIFKKRLRFTLRSKVSVGVFVWAVLKIDQYEAENRVSCMPSSLYTPLVAYNTCTMYDLVYKK